MYSPLRPRTTGASTCDARALAEREHAVDHLLRRVWLAIGSPQIQQCGVPDAREEQAQVVVDLGDRADRRARVLRDACCCSIAIAGERPVDRVDVGLLHLVEELARVGRERLDVAALALGVDRVEGERGLARAREPGDHDEPVARDRDVDAAQVVLARAADVDVGGGFGEGGVHRLESQPLRQRITGGGLATSRLSAKAPRRST